MSRYHRIESFQGMMGNVGEGSQLVDNSGAAAKRVMAGGWKRQAAARPWRARQTLAAWPTDKQDFRKTAGEGSEAFCISRWVKVIHFL